MSEEKNEPNMRTRIISRICKIICILLLIIIYKITAHQYLSSYVYANLKLTLHKWSKNINLNEDGKFCLLQNPFFNEVALNRTTCSSCETIKEITEIYQTSFEEIQLLCIHQNRPVLVSDVMFDWPKFNRITENSFSEIAAVWKQSSLHKLLPCYYETSIRHLSNNMAHYCNIISNPLIDNWFFTWKNCNLQATKYFRHLYQQPYFTKYFLPAPQVNYIITSSNYESSSYKTLPVQPNKLLVMLQLRGSLQYKLQAQKECRHSCDDIEGTLNESKTLIFNSDSREIFYLLRHNGISVSIILEYEMQR